MLGLHLRIERMSEYLYFCLCFIVIKSVSLAFAPTVYFLKLTETLISNANTISGSLALWASGLSFSFWRRLFKSVLVKFSFKQSDWLCDVCHFLIFFLPHWLMSLLCYRFFQPAGFFLVCQKLCDMFDIRLFLCFIMSTKYQTYSYRVRHWLLILLHPWKKACVTFFKKNMVPMEIFTSTWLQFLNSKFLKYIRKGLSFRMISLYSEWHK